MYCIDFYIYASWPEGTVSPNKHGNSTSAQLDSKINKLRGCVSASQTEVDKFNIVTEFPCLLGLTVQLSIVLTEQVH